MADNTWKYTNGMKVLKEGTNKNGPFIEPESSRNSKEAYVPGEKSKRFKISEFYQKPGLVSYELKTD